MSGKGHNNNIRNKKSDGNTKKTNNHTQDANEKHNNANEKANNKVIISAKVPNHPGSPSSTESAPAEKPF